MTEAGQTEAMPCKAGPSRAPHATANQRESMTTYRRQGGHRLLFPTEEGQRAYEARLKNLKQNTSTNSHATPSPATQSPPSLVADVPFEEAVARFKKKYLTELVEACGFNLTKAARFAHIERKNFTRLLKRFNVETKKQPWNGLCARCNRGLDYEGQPCDNCKVRHLLLCNVSLDGEVCRDATCPIKGKVGQSGVVCPRAQRTYEEV